MPSKGIADRQTERKLRAHGRAEEGAIATATEVDLLEAMHDIDAMLANTPSWISVKDHLPPQDERVIVFCPEFRPRYAVTTGKYNGPRYGWLCHDRFATVTHWMTMPQPPGVDAPKQPEECNRIGGHLGDNCCCHTRTCDSDLHQVSTRVDGKDSL